MPLNMHPYLILALLNMAAMSLGLSMGFRHPPSFHDSHNRRQLHNADFSSKGPAAKGAITNPAYGSSPASGSSRSLSNFDPTAPLTRRGPLDRRLISVVVNSNPGAKSTTVMNGDLALPPRAETGSRDADIDVDTMKRDHALDARMSVSATTDGKHSSPIVSRQEDQDPSGADDPDTAAVDPAEQSTSDGADPVVSRQIGLDYTLASLSNDAVGLTILDSKRMVSTDTPVNFHIPGTVSAASGGARNPRRALLDSTPGAGTTATLNSDSAQPDSLRASSPRDNILDLPVALPATPKVPSLPLRRDIGSVSPPATLSSERRAESIADFTTKRQILPVGLPVPVSLPRDASGLITSKRQNLPLALPVPVSLPRDASELATTKRQNLPAVPIALPISLPPPLSRDASAPTVDSGVFSASIPRGFVVRKEERL